MSSLDRLFKVPLAEASEHMKDVAERMGTGFVMVDIRGVPASKLADAIIEIRDPRENQVVGVVNAWPSLVFPFTPGTYSVQVTGSEVVSQTEAVRIESGQLIEVVLEAREQRETFVEGFWAGLSSKFTSFSRTKFGITRTGLDR